MDHKKAQERFAPILVPASKAYAAAMRLRARAYARGILKSQKPCAFTVALGNISWGGSGKTPLADWLLTWGRERGLTTALISRGYGGKTEQRPLLVKPRTSPLESGDEPLMLARQHPEACVLADPKRRRALDWLNAKTTTNFIVLDDAMQHLAAGRDLNLVLLRSRDLNEAWGKVIPAGEWREGPQALGRASAFMLRMPPEEFEKRLELIRQRLDTFDKPIFSFDLVPSGLTPLGPVAEEKHRASASKRNLRSTASLHLSNLGSAAYALCTGVGSPESVEASATALLGPPPSQSFIYPDHYRFQYADLKKMALTGLPIVMTAKDAVKIQPLMLQELRLECYVLESRVAFGPSLRAGANAAPCPDFPSWLEERWLEYV